MIKPQCKGSIKKISRLEKEKWEGDIVEKNSFPTTGFYI
jgi:hypothetical protein